VLGFGQVESRCFRRIWPGRRHVTIRTDSERQGYSDLNECHSSCQQILPDNHFGLDSVARRLGLGGLNTHMLVFTVGHRARCFRVQGYWTLAIKMSCSLRNCLWELLRANIASLVVINRIATLLHHPATIYAINVRYADGAKPVSEWTLFLPNLDPAVLWSFLP
jgi:hypothetical protein